MTKEARIPEALTERDRQRDPRYAGQGDTTVAETLAVGDKVLFPETKWRWTVRAKGDRYVILTQPLNPQRTVIYTAIDLALGIRGTDDCVGPGLGYETEDQIENALVKLESGEFTISVRNNVKLQITEPANKTRGASLAKPNPKETP